MEHQQNVSARRETWIRTDASPADQTAESTGHDHCRWGSRLVASDVGNELLCRLICCEVQRGADGVAHCNIALVSTLVPRSRPPSPDPIHLELTQMEMETRVQSLQTTIPDNRLRGTPGTFDTLRRRASTRLGGGALHTIIRAAAFHQHRYLCAQLGQLEGAWSEEFASQFVTWRYTN